MERELKVITDANGDPETTPDDYYMNYAVPVSKWVSQDPPWFGDLHSTKIESMEERILRFKKAEKVYKFFGSDALRDEPHVLETYNSVLGDVTETLFIFKEDNNGSTYRILESTRELF